MPALSMLDFSWNVPCAVLGILSSLVSQLIQLDILLKE